MRKKLFPAVKSFQDYDDRTTLEPIIEGWYCGFNRDLAAVKQKHHKEQQAEEDNNDEVDLLGLLKDFFAFYADFDFASKVICPYLGEILEKSALTDDARLRALGMESYANYISYVEDKKLRLNTETALCVQDPFELCRCVSATMAQSTLDHFAYACKTAAERLTQKEKAAAPNLTEIFVKLKQNPVNREGHLISKSSLSNNKTVKEMIKDEETLMRLAEKLVGKILGEVFMFTFIGEENPSKNEAKEVKKSEDLKRKMEMNDDEVRRKRHKSGQKLVKIFRYKSYVNTWDSRKKTESSMELKKVTAFEKERIISEALLERPSARCEAPLLDFEVKLESNDEAEAVSIGFEDKSAKKGGIYYHAVRNVVSRFIPRLVAAMLPELTEEECRELLAI